MIFNYVIITQIYTRYKRISFFSPKNLKRQVIYDMELEFNPFKHIILTAKLLVCKVYKRFIKGEIVTIKCNYCFTQYRFLSHLVKECLYFTILMNLQYYISIAVPKLFKDCCVIWYIIYIFFNFSGY